MPGGCDHNRLQTEQLQAGWAKVYVYRGRPFAPVDSSGGPLMGYRFVVGVAGVPALLVDDHRAQLVGHAAPAHHAVRERDDEPLEHGMLCARALARRASRIRLRTRATRSPYDRSYPQTAAARPSTGWAQTPPVELISESNERIVARCRDGIKPLR
jgi:hypothetical protein